MVRLLTLSFAAVLTASAVAASSVAFAASHHDRGRHHRASHKGASAATVTADSVNAASLDNGNGRDPSLIVKAEVLLDRKHFSPGQIDGQGGDNFKKALAAFEEANALPSGGALNADVWQSLVANADSQVLQKYTISDADVAGPFDKRIPSDLVGMANLPGLSYATPRQELAEKFHMSEALLAKLNPHAQFDRAGTEIVVAGVVPLDLRSEKRTVEVAKPASKRAETGSVATIVVDKPAHDVRAYDKDGKLIGFYPATIGSQEKPAPSGTFSVRRVAWNPDYHYDPKFAWKGVKTDQKLTVRPGPKNPVGLVWIDLSAPSYGIHGTPNPDKIGKTASHGCIRMTNWDAVDLARMVRRGTVVKFADQDSSVVPPSNGQARDNAQDKAQDNAQDKEQNNAQAKEQDDGGQRPAASGATAPDAR